METSRNRRSRLTVAKSWPSTATRPSDLHSPPPPPPRNFTPLNSFASFASVLDHVHR